MAVRRVLRRVLVFFLVLGGLWALWEGYKWLWERTGWTKPFRVNNYTLPHLHEILLQLREPTSTGDDLWLYLLHAALFTARAAAVGFLFGALIGFGLGVALSQFDVLRRGVMPYVVASPRVSSRAAISAVSSWMPWPTRCSRNVPRGPPSPDAPLSPSR